jgi:hypothetical protein
VSDVDVEDRLPPAPDLPPSHLIYQTFWQKFKKRAAKLDPLEGPFMRLLVALILASFGVALPASAATTIYATSIFSQTRTTNGANALGAANGSVAVVRRNGNIVLQMSSATSGLNTVINGVRATANTNVRVAIGHVVGGVATFSANVALPAGFGSVHTLDLSAACAAISATGCSLLRVRVQGPSGSAFRLDGVSGVAAAPEPVAWALMMTGFGAVAWRMKRMRVGTALAPG